MALLLSKRGITRVRPLAGGFHGWKERGFPMQTAIPGTLAVIAEKSGFSG